MTAIRLRRDRFMVRLALLAATAGTFGLAVAGIGWARLVKNSGEGLYWLLVVVGSLILVAAVTLTLWVLVEAAPVRLGPDGIAVRAAGRSRVLLWSEVKRLRVRSDAEGGRVLVAYPIDGGHAVLGRSGGPGEPVVLGGVPRAGGSEVEALAAIERWSGLPVED